MSRSKTSGCNSSGIRIMTTSDFRTASAGSQTVRPASLAAVHDGPPLRTPTHTSKPLSCRFRAWA